MLILSSHAIRFARPNIIVSSREIIELQSWVRHFYKVMKLLHSLQRTRVFFSDKQLPLHYRYLEIIRTKPLLSLRQHWTHNHPVLCTVGVRRRRSFEYCSPRPEVLYIIRPPFDRRGCGHGAIDGRFCRPLRTAKRRDDHKRGRGSRGRRTVAIFYPARGQPHRPGDAYRYIYLL